MHRYRPWCRPWPSPSTPIKSAVLCAIIWNKEFNSLTLYKERYHRYRATSSRAVLVGVLGDPSFLPGLFLRHAAGLSLGRRCYQKAPLANYIASFLVASLRDPKAGVAARTSDRCSASSAYSLDGRRDTFRKPRVFIDKLAPFPPRGLCE